MTSQDHRGKARAAFATYVHNFSQGNPDWARPFLRRNLRTALEKSSKSLSRRDQNSFNYCRNEIDMEMSDKSIKRAASSKTPRTNLNIDEIFISAAEDQALNSGRRRKMPTCSARISAVKHQDVILFYTYTTINDEGLVEPLQDEVRGRGFICALCRQKNPSWNILRHHLKIEHEEFNFTCTVSAVDLNVFFVKLEESKPIMQRSFLLDQTDVIQLGPPRRQFELKKFLDGEDESWVSSRRGPDDETAGSKGHRVTAVRQVPTVESLKPSPMTIFEFDVSAPSPQPRKLLIVPETKGRLFHSKSKRVLIPGETVPQDEDDVDIEWRIARHSDVLRDFTDLSDDDKDYAIHFDAFLMRKSRVERGGIRPTFVQFVRENEAWIVERRSRSLQLGLHMATLQQRGGKGGMDIDTIEYVAGLLREFRIKREVEKATNLLNARKEIEKPKEVWPPLQVRRRGFCSCLTFVYPGPDQLICSNIYCKHRKYHRGCLGIPETVVFKNFGPDQFKCDYCTEAALSPNNYSTPTAATSVVSPRLIENIDRTLDQHPSSPSTVRLVVAPETSPTTLNRLKPNVERAAAPSVNSCSPSTLKERPIETLRIPPVRLRPPKVTLETVSPSSALGRRPSPRKQHLVETPNPSPARANLAKPTIETKPLSTSWNRRQRSSPSGRWKGTPKLSPAGFAQLELTPGTTPASHTPSRNTNRYPDRPATRIQSRASLAILEPGVTVDAPRPEIPSPVVASSQTRARIQRTSSATAMAPDLVSARLAPSDRGVATLSDRIIAAQSDGSLATSSEPSPVASSDRSPTTSTTPTQASVTPTIAPNPVSAKHTACYGSQNNPVELESSPEPDGSPTTQPIPRRRSEKIIIDLLGEKPKQISGPGGLYPLVRANSHRRKPQRPLKYA